MQRLDCIVRGRSIFSDETTRRGHVRDHTTRTLATPVLRGASVCARALGENHRSSPRVTAIGGTLADP